MQISAGSGNPRYSLHFPFQPHPLAGTIDLVRLARELSDLLATEVTAGQGPGCEQLRIGPFPTEQEAELAFHRAVRCLATLCVDRQYPIYFLQELAPLMPPQEIWGFAQDGVDAIANLTRPCIFPEHQTINDGGVAFARLVSRVTSDELSDSVIKASRLSTRLPERLTIAFEAYVLACAAPAPAMRLVGFVNALEAISEVEMRPANEISALDDFKATLLDTGVSTKSQSHEDMFQLLDKSIENLRRKTSITERVRNLVSNHAFAVRNYLHENHPFRDNIDRGTKQLYDCRSKIIHAGTWGVHFADRDNMIQFSEACAKAVFMEQILAA